MTTKTLNISKISLVTGCQVTIGYLDFVTVGEEEVYAFEHKVKGKAPIHIDFRNAFKAMEQWVYPTVPLDKSEIKLLVVTDISLKLMDDGVGIKMSCTVQKKNVPRPTNFPTPFWSTMDSENPLPAEAVTDIEKLKEEAVAYLGDKFDSVQLKFDPEETAKRLQDETANENVQNSQPDQKPAKKKMAVA